MYKGFLSTSEAHLQFLNRQAGVPLRINRKILAVMEGINSLTGKARNVGKFIPLPIRDHFVGEMQEHLKDRPSSDPEKRRMRDALKEQIKAFFKREATAKALRIADLLMVANFCKDDQQFWLPTRSDFRGRTYPTAPLLSYQGIDPSKALLEFAEPVEVDERTRFWMEVDLSGNMGFDKASYSERQSYVQAHLELIVDSVQDPINHDFWKNQDKPWLFLAVAQEYVRLFVDHDQDRLTRCRVSVDATCSGQQLMAGLTRSLATAQQVNLVPQDRPTDVYGNVIAVAAKAIQAHQDGVVQFLPRGKQHPAEAIKPSKLSELTSCDRAARKRARAGGKAIVMVAQYGAGKARRITELAEKCQLQSGTFTEPEAAALYPFFKTGLDECLECLDPFLQWCQGVAKAALVNADGTPKFDPDTGLPKTVILIPSADGSITTQSYRLMEDQGRIVTDHLGSFANKKKRRFEKDELPTGEPDLSKHISSTAANLIHAQDGAVLALALGDLELPFTTCHDSISGRPSREMDQIVDRLLTALFEVFTSDVLQKFVELNGLEWKDHPAPNFGTYDPSLVLKASLAFS
jgi:DNA-directed RNA polymerase